MVASTKKKSSARPKRAREQLASATPVYRTQPRQPGEPLHASAVPMLSTDVEPSLAPHQLSWLLHESAKEWAAYAHYLEALAFPSPVRSSELRRARAVARTLRATFSAYVNADESVNDDTQESDLAALEATAQRTLRRPYRMGKLDAWPTTGLVLPEFQPSPVSVTTFDPFGSDEKRHAAGRRRVVETVVAFLAEMLRDGADGARVVTFLRTGAGGRFQGRDCGLGPSPFDQLQGFFQAQRYDYRAADAAALVRVVDRLLLDHRTNALDTNAAEELAKTVLRRVLTKLVGKEPARALFDAERKRDERAIARGGTRL